MGWGEGGRSTSEQAMGVAVARLLAAKRVRVVRRGVSCILTGWLVVFLFWWVDLGGVVFL
jgi:hypothetical protein